VTRARMLFTKWGERPHWEFGAELLGRDEHGHWLGLPHGSVVARPGATITTGEDQVVLVPDDAWVSTFYAAGGTGPWDVYVDVSTVPTHETSVGLHVVRAVDLDLDVLRGRTGRVWVDDEDEFAEHRSRYGYPDEVVETALASCMRVHEALRLGVAPFDAATAASWLARLRGARDGGETQLGGRGGCTHE
jgi:protein associated with RNAse G/E